jgi:hypothetical protein
LSLVITAGVVCRVNKFGVFYQNSLKFGGFGPA